MAMTVAAQPATTWLARTHNFGVIKEADGKVSCTVLVVNTGTEPLLIIKAQAGCGCTGIDYPEGAIMPGDTARVTITYNPSGRPGQFNKQVIIFTNTMPKRTVLEITGNVIPTDETLNRQYPLRAGDLRISQGNIPFGELTRGQGKTLFLSAYNASTDTLLVDVTGAKAHIRPAVVPDTVPPARVTALTVHYTSAYAPLWGLNIDTLKITSRHLGAETTDSADVHVMAQVLENFDNLTDKQRQDAPVIQVDCGDRIDFGSMTGNDKATRSFKATNRGKDNLIIRRLWVPEGEGVTVLADRHEIKRGKTATITITVDPSAIDGDLLNAPLTLMCNDPDSPRVTIRLVGIIDKK